MIMHGVSLRNSNLDQIKSHKHKSKINNMGLGWHVLGTDEDGNCLMAVTWTS